MIYYANPCSEAAKESMTAGRIGCITTPHQGNPLQPEWDVMADNGCFSNRWTYNHWSMWMDKVPTSVRFAVAPDVVSERGELTHDDTVRRWETYAPLIRDRGLVPAFVGQPGCTPDGIPEDAEVFFIGGTTEWKLGPQARECVVACKEKDMWVHMGRVNSRKRCLIANEMGCDSVDGTKLVFAPDRHLPMLESWMLEINGVKQ